MGSLLSVDKNVIRAPPKKRIREVKSLHFTRFNPTFALWGGITKCEVSHALDTHKFVTVPNWAHVNMTCFFFNMLIYNFLQFMYFHAGHSVYISNNYIHFYQCCPNLAQAASNFFFIWVGEHECVLVTEFMFDITIADCLLRHSTCERTRKNSLR